MLRHPGNSLKLVAQTFTRPSLLLVKNQHIRTDTERNSKPPDHIKGRLRSATFIATYLQYGHASHISESLLSQSARLAQSGKPFRELHSEKPGC